MDMFWLTQSDDRLKNLDEFTKTLVMAYEYILSDQWGKGTPDPVMDELKHMRKGGKK